MQLNSIGIAMSHSDRRDFLKTAGALPAAAVIAPSAVFAHAKPSSEAPARELLRSDFEPLIGQEFSISEMSNNSPAFGSIQLKVLEELHYDTDRERSFRAVFQAVGEQGVPQNSWMLTHPALGTHMVFMSPNDATGRVIEAIFNRG